MVKVIGITSLLVKVKQFNFNALFASQQIKSIQYRFVYWALSHLHSLKNSRPFSFSKQKWIFAFISSSFVPTVCLESKQPSYPDFDALIIYKDCRSIIYSSHQNLDVNLEGAYDEQNSSNTLDCFHHAKAALTLVSELITLPNLPRLMDQYEDRIKSCTLAQLWQRAQLLQATDSQKQCLG